MTCPTCGATLPEGAMFCGECGTATRSATGAISVVPVGGPALEEPVGADPASAPSSAAPVPPAAPARTPQSAPVPLPPMPSADATDKVNSGAIFVPVPDEHTRLPTFRAAAPAARFVLQFSTGESVTVTGTGLVGRRPEPQPGEAFDSLVAIDDPGRSVSKTHLEFGQEGGVFWVSDRFSANGTVVREPERPARLSAPGMRSRVPRGSRVEIGEQFFVVS
ncbi:zinc-ribbon domain-containing protein [Naasia sp. SYSU D00057]|uniref:zinc-ribbon domain-containing protein n=1 Tax=Naasia sp. SYSU D00057 TaxID=2817380 RepID=UPI001B306564|nr:zinc ribbon domain-containing protein [Naasia sp. SYSU D00057]